MFRWLAFPFLLLAPSLGLACPTCTCANPALTAIGADQPFAGRIRLAATMRAWEQREGVREVDLSSLRELRLDLTASWSPVSRWTFMLNLPLQVRELTQVSLSKERGFGSGELDASVRFLLVGASGFRPRHLVSLLLSARVPTAPTLNDRAGVALSTDAQLGPGALVPAAGLSWSAFIGDRWSTFVSLVGDVPLEGRYGLRVGPGVQALGTAQFQPWNWLGLRAGLDARYEAPSYLRDVERAELSGFLFQALADVVFSVASSRVLLSLGGRIPFADTRPGPVQQSPILLASVLVDL